MAVFRAIYDTLSDGIVINSEVVSDEYDGAAQTCEQLENSITTLNEQQTIDRRAACSNSLPTPPAEFMTEYRACSQRNVIISTENGGAP